MWGMVGADGVGIRIQFIMFIHLIHSLFSDSSKEGKW